MRNIFGTESMTMICGGISRDITQEFLVTMGLSETTLSQWVLMRVMKAGGGDILEHFNMI